MVPMTASDYCDLCDLPRSQCVHGMPPPPPAPKKTPTQLSKPAASPRKRTTSPPRPSTTTRPVVRRRTPPDAFKPLIVSVLQEAGGELEADELFLELEILTEDRLLPEDKETTPEGELRWQYAARRARVALIKEGLMKKGRPGMWQLA
jgi:hypothetical protein